MPGSEEIELFIDSDAEQPRRQKSKIATVIAIVGWLLIGFNVNAVIFSSFPLKLALPEWQLNFIVQLLSASTSFLIGATLIAISTSISPQERMLKDWSRIASRLAALFAVVLVLSIPTQFYLGSRALKNQTIKSYETVNMLRTMVKGISAANTEAEFRLYLSSLTNPPALPDKLDAPFPVFKQRAIEIVQSKINAASENIQLQKSESLQVFLKEVIRNTAQSILMAAAFSAIAGLNSKAGNPITRLLESFL